MSEFASPQSVFIPATGRPDRRAGFSLVEVLVCVAMLSFVALGVASLLTIVVHQNRLARERSIATSLASERIQKMQSMPFQAVADYAKYKLPEETAASGTPKTFTSNYGIIPGFPGYKRIVELTYDTPVTGMLQVKSRVYWKNLRQGEKNHEMVTLFYPGLE